MAGSKRAADPAVAAGIARALRRRVETVGVFVNPTLDEVAHAAEGIGLTHVQLHGDEGPSFCTAVAERTGLRVIKALRVGSRADIRAPSASTPTCTCSTPPPARRAAAPAARGTGRWPRSATRTSPLILSGGLTPENVADGIAAVRPWAVDVASGVESAPGIKDPAKVEAFMAAAPGAAAVA